MIDRIFIPTVARANNQIAYHALPPDLRQRVTLVVQAWEREQYMYDCDYLVLPDTPIYHHSHRFCIAQTRKAIYEAGRALKYCVLDDDIRFYRRNSKYWSSVSNMEKSKREATDDDVREMFDRFDHWLDEPTVTVCGCAQIENPPAGVAYRTNTSMTSAFWINGPRFADILPTMDLTSVRVGEDICLLLGLLTRGYGNRVTEEFLTYNTSNNQRMESVLWDQQTYEATLRDHQYLEQLFPGIYSVVYDDTGTRESGGYRNHGKSKIRWSAAFRTEPQSTLF